MMNIKSGRTIWFKSYPNTEMHAAAHESLKLNVISGREKNQESAHTYVVSSTEKVQQKASVC